MSRRSKKILANLVRLRPFEFGMLSDVRYMHDAVIRRLTDTVLSEREVSAFQNLIYGEEYSRILTCHNVTTAWIERQLVGSASWCPLDDGGETARICDVFVHPLYKGAGIGTLLLEDAEASIAKAGFSWITLRAPGHLTPFLLRHGYSLLSHGTCSIAPDVKMRVAFLRKVAGLAEHRTRPSPDAPCAKAGPGNGHPPTPALAREPAERASPAAEGDTPGPQERD